MTNLNLKMLIENLCFEYFETVEARELKARELRLKYKDSLCFDGSLWIPSLEGSDAYRQGELCERVQAKDDMVNLVCKLNGIDSTALFSLAKSIRNWYKRTEWQRSFPYEKYEEEKYFYYCDKRRTWITETQSKLLTLCKAA